MAMNTKKNKRLRNIPIETKELPGNHGDNDMKTECLHDITNYYENKKHAKEKDINKGS